MCNLKRPGGDKPYESRMISRIEAIISFEYAGIAAQSGTSSWQPSHASRRHVRR